MRESSIITAAKHPRYVVNGSKESSLHVCQLLNEALRRVEKKTAKTSAVHSTELHCKVIIQSHSNLWAEFNYIIKDSQFSLVLHYSVQRSCKGANFYCPLPNSISLQFWVTIRHQVILKIRGKGFWGFLLHGEWGKKKQKHKLPIMTPVRAVSFKVTMLQANHPRWTGACGLIQGDMDSSCCLLNRLCALLLPGIGSLLVSGRINQSVTTADELWMS